MKIGVIGGGASGFFSAIHIKENYPDAEVIIFEKSQNVLAKVKISGGGRCNLTNGENSIKKLLSAYPRGTTLLKKLFSEFSTPHTQQWFEDRGVPLVTQDDNCVFPQSQDSQSIISCLVDNAMDLGVEIKSGFKVDRIIKNEQQFEIIHSEDKTLNQQFDKIIITTGGSPLRKNLKWLEDLGHKIEKPVPSLFTFNIPNNSINNLMGIVVENSIVNIPGTKLSSSGALLVTHWGLSGPAILKLSAFGAKHLNDLNYKFDVNINWAGISKEDEIRLQLKEIVSSFPNKQISNYRPFDLQDRLWKFLIGKLGIIETKKWSEVGKKDLNRITNILMNDAYKVSGQTTFRDEFVTCGGISLDSVNHKTLESKEVKGLYFAGEVLDIDGITGGYNLQAAWLRRDRSGYR